MIENLLEYKPPTGSLWSWFKKSQPSKAWQLSVVPHHCGRSELMAAGDIAPSVTLPHLTTVTTGQVSITGPQSNIHLITSHKSTDHFTCKFTVFRWCTDIFTMLVCTWWGRRPGEEVFLDRSVSGCARAGYSRTSSSRSLRREMGIGLVLDIISTVRGIISIVE